jgi:hypothetical protein
MKTQMIRCPAVVLFSVGWSVVAQQSAGIELTLKGQWLEALGWVSQIAVSGNHAYVGGDGLHVIDISDPARPQRVGSYGVSDLARGVAVLGNHAYVGFWEGGLHVIDIGDPANPQRVGSCPTDRGTSQVVVSGNYAFVSGTNALQIIDISEPANPRQVSRYKRAAGVAVVGNYAYVAAEGAGLHVFDVRNPADPVRVGGYDTSGSALAVAVSGNRIYVADGEKGLPNVQYAMRVDGAAPGTPCVIEATPALGPAAQWNALFTNASPTGPFDFTDFDVRITEQPQKFYRARQP